MEKWGFWGVYVKNRGFSRKIERFNGEIEVFSKNGVFMGFWSRNWRKVGKSREFDDFLKIGEIREK